MPAFFLLDRADGKFEVVDGKQRMLAILGFCRGHLESVQGVQLEPSPTTPEAKAFRERFLSYPVLIAIIENLEADDPIEHFYSLVNSTGLRLNRPELRKAEFYSTNLLRLVTNLAGLKEFHNLGLFTALSAQRMNDVDFASELVAQLKFGITDKKEKVDDLYERDITDTEFDQLRTEFVRILEQIHMLNRVAPISRTRYRQKNDFYTLFGFLHVHPDIQNSTLAYFFKVLVKIGPYIRPSQDQCVPLKNYALNCVTQSNSRKAREERLVFFEKLLLNPATIPTTEQAEILRFFKVDEKSLVKLDSYTTIREEDLHDPDQEELSF